MAFLLQQPELRQMSMGVALSRSSAVNSSLDHRALEPAPQSDLLANQSVLASHTGLHKSLSSKCLTSSIPVPGTSTSPLRQIPFFMQVS